MKKVKIYMTVTFLALFALTIAACDGVAPTNLGLDLQGSGQSHSAEDNNYSNTSLVKSRSTDGGSGDSTSSSREGQKFSGSIDAVTANTITLNGVTFTVDTQQDLTTLFSPGTTFTIEYRQSQDGTITIDQFQSEDDQGEDNYYDVEFEGMIEQVEPTSITLNGEPFEVTTDVDLTTLFVAGEYYEIKYVFNENGTITIVDFHPEDDSQDMNDDSSDNMDDSSDDSYDESDNNSYDDNNNYNDNEDNNNYDNSNNNMDNENNDSSNNN
jgi:hypothetical protein